MLGVHFGMTIGLVKSGHGTAIVIIRFPAWVNVKMCPEGSKIIANIHAIIVVSIKIYIYIYISI